jgi:hypothetical protein
VSGISTAVCGSARKGCPENDQAFHQGNWWYFTIVRRSASAQGRCPGTSHRDLTGRRMTADGCAPAAGSRSAQVASCAPQFEGCRPIDCWRAKRSRSCTQSASRGRRMAPQKERRILRTWMTVKLARLPSQASRCRAQCPGFDLPRFDGRRDYAACCLDIDLKSNSIGLIYLALDGHERALRNSVVPAVALSLIPAAEPSGKIRLVPGFLLNYPRRPNGSSDHE